jgi:enamine deaminase RidA (YjgF/YER057c/UK114 family)
MGVLNVGPTLPGGIYDPTKTYVLKAHVEGTELKAKLWEPADPADPAADEPAAWAVVANPTAFTSGQFGIQATKEIFQFDNVSVQNPEGS